MKPAVELVHTVLFSQNQSYLALENAVATCSHHEDFVEEGGLFSSIAAWILCSNTAGWENRRPVYTRGGAESVDLPGMGFSL